MENWTTTPAKETQAGLVKNNCGIFSAWSSHPAAETTVLSKDDVRIIIMKYIEIEHLKHLITVSDELCVIKHFISIS